MARQRGGSYGSKGSGETQLELDRRAVMNKIAVIKKDLEKVVRERATQRKRRDKVPVPSCALVGYTNAGKSSMLNALTGASVFVENKLFATLDPTTRRLRFPGGSEILLTDTVGFISNLPHTLVDAFRATLEEASYADLILIVLDASDENCGEQYKTTLQVLDEIGAGEKPRLLVLNKIDAVSTGFARERLAAVFPDAFEVSAKTGEGFDALVSEAAAVLTGETYCFRFPAGRGDLAALVYRNGSVLDIRWENDGICVCARTPQRIVSRLQEYVCACI